MTAFLSRSQRQAFETQGLHQRLKISLCDRGFVLIDGAKGVVAESVEHEAVELIRSAGDQAADLTVLRRPRAAPLDRCPKSLAAHLA